MDNILDIVKLLSNANSSKDSKPQPIPKEVSDQYPYGEFPLKYTKSGQETIRKQSENRFSYTDSPPQNDSKKEQDNNLGMLLPLIQIMSSGKKQPKDLMKILSKLLFKDNPEMEKLFNLIPNIKNQEIKKEDHFPDTNKVQISSLKKVE